MLCDDRLNFGPAMIQSICVLFKKSISTLAFVWQLVVIVQSAVYRSVLYQHAQTIRPLAKRFFFLLWANRYITPVCEKCLRSFGKVYDYRSSAPISPSARASMLAEGPL